MGKKIKKLTVIIFLTDSVVSHMERFFPPGRGMEAKIMYHIGKWEGMGESLYKQSGVEISPH